MQLASCQAYGGVLRGVGGMACMAQLTSLLVAHSAGPCWQAGGWPASTSTFPCSTQGTEGCDNATCQLHALGTRELYDYAWCLTSTVIVAS
jgi:hypothetical protein